MFWCTTKGLNTTAHEYGVCSLLWFIILINHGVWSNVVYIKIPQYITFATLLCPLVFSK